MREEHERAAGYRECCCTGSASGTPVKIKAIIPLCSRFETEVARDIQPLFRRLESRFPSSYPIRISSLTTSGFLFALPPQIATELKPKPEENRFLYALRKNEKKRRRRRSLFKNPSIGKSNGEMCNEQSSRFRSRVESQVLRNLD